MPIANQRLGIAALGLVVLLLYFRPGARSRDPRTSEISMTSIYVNTDDGSGHKVRVHALETPAAGAPPTVHAAGCRTPTCA